MKKCGWCEVPTETDFCSELCKNYWKAHEELAKAIEKEKNKADLEHRRRVREAATETFTRDKEMQDPENWSY